jgi:hypothetical protein
MYLFFFLVLSMMVPDLSLSASRQEGNSADWARILPDTISGWQKEEDRIFTRDNLYSYIDGGAELYLSYGFQTVLSRTYLRQDQPDLVIEIFDMASSAHAFGIFAHTRETLDSTFGQGSQYTEGLLLFWKNKYYISVLASPETAESKQALIDLARIIEAAIPDRGELPRLLQCLPRKGIIEESIRFFQHYIWLNAHYYIADQNILHIGPDTEALLARYRQVGDKSLILLVVKYVNKAEAASACKDFISAYMPGLNASPVVQIEDGTWTGYCLFQDLLVVAFNGDSEKIIEHSLQETVSAYQKIN